MNRLRKLPWKLRYLYGERLASRWRRRMLLLTNMHADVRIAKNTRLGPGFRLYMPEGGKFIVHPGCDFRRDFVCEIYGGGTVEIGAGTTFTSSAFLQITTRLTIHPRSAFGQATQITDGNHRWRDPDVHMFEQGYDYTPLDMGPGAMVFSKCTVFASLGERAIVGANSLVSKPVPAYCFAAGTPARILEYYGRPENRPEGLEAG